MLVFISLLAVQAFAQQPDLDPMVKARNKFDELIQASPKLSDDVILAGLEVSYDQEPIPNVIAYGVAFESWSNRTLIIEQNKQFIEFSYKTLSENTFAMNYSVQSDAKLGFNVSETVDPTAITFNSTTEGTFEVTQKKKSFVLMFDCSEDGQHEVRVTFSAFTQQIVFGFKKNCQTISNQNLFVDIIDGTKRTIIQDKDKQATKDHPYTMISNSIDLELKTLTESQILIEPLSIINSNLTGGEQAVELRKNDKRGGLVGIEKQLKVNLKATCFQVSTVEYVLQINSKVFDNPLTIKLIRQCNEDQLETPITNFTQFPVLIGTIREGSDVYRPGQVADEYQLNSSVQRLIPDNEDAEIFYVTVMKDEFGDALRKSHLQMARPHLEYESHILSIIDDAPNLNQQVWRRPMEILLVFKCKKEGKTNVKMELDFTYGSNKSQTIQVYFNKECGTIVEEQEQPSFFADFFYYVVCFAGIIFGVLIIRIFKRLMQREAEDETFMIDTTYKRRYDQIQELPVKQ